ncbi:MAG: polyribonucleotide nucleotidyltransferase [Flavobacteriales bacterium]
MNFEVKTKTLDMGNGKAVTIETGKLARQADGAVKVTLGGTVLLATVVANNDVPMGIDFMPLTVDYREKYSASGKFPGGFFKREARPSDDEILVMRLVDRALRPLFPDDFHGDTQVMIQLLSYDNENQPDAIACLAASAALAVSDVPFNGPVSEVRVVRVNGEYIVNPTKSEAIGNDLDLIVAGMLDNIIMVEGEMKEVQESDMLKGISVAHQAIKKQCQLQVDLAAEVPKAQTKREYCHEVHDLDLKKRIDETTFQKCYEVAKLGLADKKLRGQKFKAIIEEFKATLTEEEINEKGFLIRQYYHKTQKEAVRKCVLDNKMRLDGRKTDEIRPIACEIDILPAPHGSALFTRGETQSLTLLTLGNKLDEQMADGALERRSDNFMLHYNFPPFSTGEARPLRGVGRREIGHGNLALRALKAVIPQAPENPYTIRLVSDILESNGSSSMATVCAGTLALMDGGVQIKKPVSGIAMGLISEPHGRYAILSDILGDEDHLGDMDFKVTGTPDGITACQMDMKVEGLSYEMLEEALNQAKRGREHIMGEMMKTIDKPRADYKPQAPRIVKFEVPEDVVGAIIGPGGKIIQEIQKTTGAVIVVDDGANGMANVEISSANRDAMEAAVRRVKSIAFPPTVEVGEVYEGKVKTLMPYGAFVEILPGTDGLLHVSELDWKRIEDVSTVLKEGDIVKFKVLGKDPKNGKFKLSRKVLLEKPEQAPQAN